MPSIQRIRQEASRVTKLLQKTPFEQCWVLEKSFSNLSFQPGVYAIKSQTEEILYVGMASAFRTRFQNGHQALMKILISGVPVEQIRILTVPISGRYVDYLLQLEKDAIFTLQPRYNVRIPSIKELTGMTTTITTGHLKDVLKFLPSTIVDALEDHADAYGLSDNQVLEMAISQFLDLDSTSFDGVQKFKGVAALQEENEILKMRLKAAGLSTEIDSELG